MVLPAVKILDAIYSTRITLEGLALQHGMKHEDWPEAVLESLKARHNYIYSQIEDQICSLGGAYHPLGAIYSLTVQTQDKLTCQNTFKYRTSWLDLKVAHVYNNRLVSCLLQWQW